MSKQIPIFLLGYDLFQELEKWQQSTPNGRWELRTFPQNSSMIWCRLTWVETPPNIVSIEHCALNPQEAVWCVLEKYKHHVRNN